MIERVPCRFRIPVSREGNTIIFISEIVGSEVAASGLRQRFEDGACDLLTAYDIGPMECRRPNDSEHTCPDISDLRSQLHI
ncbi:hypothetical protein A2630_04860 [Candidatus Woesebacteria bacterium RIFCSPHIGHO2_01_FULL_44_10]|uniref:Uncharacterized protein n=1 Tax=Candidatus Woesebacteria bacterium RIFCSPLOWO2_01_FULL_44_14 TaxID=1802525 RepID=A0A1F8C231_9BACT|nr:MAG: hypothetical protein A2630_04860 [Candidatus Woesebacteria bacterium RIFCSPHIGHO2_01_FULL_44_10]OGM54761.1 MAG: hypothetical protein A3F62_01675 [Candidatus Woesebacteria bacterium RIFCSPHIGHO2_12_FULL_44_11]OGM69665.1 MAG: hypothetical protein A2975_00960 [Candidatus Woesebacteria bacterium RIFCSPLOWO2_01_FULL_44_14]